MLAIPRPAAPAVLRISGRKQRNDADDVADELIAAILLHGGRWALFVLPNNEARYTSTRSIRFQDWCVQWPGSLCGIYDPDVERSSLIEDILAMVRQ